MHGRSDYYALSVERLVKKNAFETAASVIWRIAHVLMDFHIAFAFRNRRRYPFWQNYLYERTLPHVGVLGLYYEHVRRLLSVL